MSYGHFRQRALAEDQMLSALVELTYRCNLDCYFCYNDLSLKGRALSVEQYKSFFDDLEKMGVMNLILSGGEPLSHPDFFAIGAYGRERNFMVRIKSNGHALRGEIARRVASEIDPFMVDTSLHGGVAATHDRQTRVPGSFDRLLVNIAEWRSLEMKVKINCTLTRWNEHEVEQIFEIADRLDCRLQIDPEVTPRDDGDTEPLDISPTQEGIRGLYEFQARRARALALEGPDAPQPATIGRQDADLMKAAPAGPTELRKHCGAGSTGIAVDPFGDVFPCVQWRRSIGNLHQTSIIDIWQDRSELDEIRQITANAATMMDAEGDKGQYMAFCPGLAHTHSGDPLKIYDGSRSRGSIILEAYQGLSGNVAPELADQKPKEKRRLPVL